eukprot:365492-Chlamydomonas_euryale.AAC.11
MYVRSIGAGLHWLSQSVSRRFEGHLPMRRVVDTEAYIPMHTLRADEQMRFCLGAATSVGAHAGAACVYDLAIRLSPRL